MVNEFLLADIGEGLTEAEVVRWLVSVGDQVKVDQTLVEVETAKAVTELPSPFGGTVLHLGAPEGATIEVGELIAAIGEPGEAWPPDESSQSAPPPIVGSLSEEAQDLSAADATDTDPAPWVKALPLVRKLARDLGIDLWTVNGTGPHGRITRDDVQAAARSAAGADEAAPARVEDVRWPTRGRADDVGGQTSAQASDVRQPLSPMRRTIATNLSRAWSEIPMVSAFDDIDVGRLLQARKALAEHYGKPMPLDALLVAAVLPVLRVYPEFNSSLDGDTLVLHRRHDIGLAVDTPDGLMVAVIADASVKSLSELADEVVKLGQGARDRALRTEELAGQTFTLSNIGAVGGSGYGTPLVPPGTTAILSTGRATDKPVVRHGQIEAASMMPVSLSYDHRVIDGAMGRRFLAMLTDVLSEPALIRA
jgi:pyruvate dehydrogenase E2 component (dihydrolipoamide acetyltransferase)